MFVQKIGPNRLMAFYGVISLIRMSHSDLSWIDTTDKEMSNHHLVASRAETVLQTVALTLPALLIATQLVAEHFREQNLFIDLGIKRLAAISIAVTGSVGFLLISALFSVLSLLGGFDSELFLDLSLISLLVALLFGGVGVVLATFSTLLTWKITSEDMK